MSKFLRSNSKLYCITNIFICILCIGYLYRGYDNNYIEEVKEPNEVIASNDTEPLPTNKTSVKEKTVVTNVRNSTTSKRYVKPAYDSVTGNNVVDYAKKYLGLRYVSGGNSLSTGTDCSGFTKLIFQEFGIKIGRTVSSQLSSGKYVSKSDLQKGDLVFYGYNDGRARHVAIYIGDNKVIHESVPKDGVKISTVNMMEYITARRLILKSAEINPITDNVKEETETVTNESNNEENEIIEEVIPENNDVDTKSEYGTSN